MAEIYRRRERSRYRVGRRIRFGTADQRTALGQSRKYNPSEDRTVAESLELEDFGLQLGARLCPRESHAERQACRGDQVRRPESIRSPELSRAGSLEAAGSRCSRCHSLPARAMDASKGRGERPRLRKTPAIKRSRNRVKPSDSLDSSAVHSWLIQPHSNKTRQLFPGWCASDP